MATETAPTFDPRASDAWVDATQALQEVRRGAATPYSEAVCLINALTAIYEAWNPSYLHDPEQSFRKKFLEPMISEELLSGDEMLAIMARAEQDTGRGSPTIDYLLTACAYAINAGWAHHEGKSALAWTYIIDGARILGWIEAMKNPDDPLLRAQVMQSSGRRGGVQTHADSRVIADDVKHWCETHLPKYAKMRRPSLNRIAGDVTKARAKAGMKNLSEDTYRRWLTEWAKGWRADGRWPP